VIANPRLVGIIGTPVNCHLYGYAPVPREILEAIRDEYDSEGETWDAVHSCFLPREECQVRPCPPEICARQVNGPYWAGPGSWQDQLTRSVWMDCRALGNGSPDVCHSWRSDRGGRSRWEIEVREDQIEVGDRGG